jgi:hypothetical protein
MTKHFCDRCGAETRRSARVSYEAGLHDAREGRVTDSACLFTDLCEGCLERFKLWLIVPSAHDGETR